MATRLKPDPSLQSLGRDYAEKYGFHDPDHSLYKAPKGLNEELVRQISAFKDEPEWMLEFRLKALKYFLARPMPTWGSPHLAEVDFEDIHYFVRASERSERSWDEVPEEVKRTFDRLGIPEAERKFLAGVSAQYDSESVYHQMSEKLAELGVIFTDMDTGLREHEALVREYFATVIPANDNKLAALNSACWSGGSFLFIPKGVHVEMPLQAYFRINTESMGQFERTLIIAEEGSFGHYVEGCHLAGSRVRVRDGEKPIEQVEEGELVLTHRGRFREVKETMKREYVGPIFSISLQGDTAPRLAVTPQHPFLVSRAARPYRPEIPSSPEWLEAHQLRPGDRLAVPIRIEPAGSLSETLSPLEDEERGVLTLAHLETILPPAESFSWLPISSIRRVQVKCPVYNMSVEEDESYLCEGVVSHNCTAPTYSSQSLHSAVVEIMVKPGARLRYTTVQNWSDNVFNLVTKRAIAQRDATMEWVDCNLGCLPESARVETLERGVVPINEVRWDDSVYGMDPKSLKRVARRVVATRENGVQPVFLLKTEDAHSLEATGNHPLLVLQSEQEGAPRLSWKRLEEIQVGEQVASLRGNEFALEEEDPPLRFQRVVSIEPAGEQETYDLEVDGIANFLANGLVVHNSRLTMKYPSIYLTGERAHGEILSIAFAGKGQHQDAGGKIIHAAPRTTSSVFAKSISKDGGRSSYRGLLEVAKGARGSKAKVVCDALLLDEYSRSDTYPTIRIGEPEAEVGHEASVSKVGEEQLFYLMSHGLSEEEAAKLIVNGFIEPIVKELPMEYAVEMNRLIELQMEGSIG